MRHQARENGFALVAKRRMAEVVRKGDGFRQIGVQLERAGDVARDGRDFHRVREPGAKVIAGAVEKNLRLVFEAAKGAGMDDTVTVALIMRAPFWRGLLVIASTRVVAELRVRREDLAFDLFQF